MFRNPLLSVYIPTHNRAMLLTRALESVWRQRDSRCEIIVIDDGSADRTPELLDQWAAMGKLRWCRNNHPVGACAARNLAIQEARGKFVMGLDDDDEMCPGRIGTLLAALRSYYAFVCASDWLIPRAGTARLRIVPSHINEEMILSRNVVGNQICAERKKILGCNGFDESLPSAQDYDLWIRMILKYGPARGVIRPLQRVYIGRTDSISTSSLRRRGYWMVYRKHRSNMTPDSRRAHLYNLRRYNGRPTRIPHDFLYWARNNRARLLWHALRSLTTGVAG